MEIAVYKKAITIFDVIAITLFTAGLALVWYFAHWAAAVGVIFLIFSNNLRLAANLLKKADKLADIVLDAADNRYVRK